MTHDEFKTTSMGNTAEGHASFLTVLETEDFPNRFQCVLQGTNINTFILIILMQILLYQFSAS